MGGAAAGWERGVKAADLQAGHVPAGSCDQKTREGIVPFISAGFTLVTMIAVTVRLDWQLALVALAISPPLLLPCSTTWYAIRAGPSGIGTVPRITRVVLSWSAASPAFSCAAASAWSGEIVAGAGVPRSGLSVEVMNTTAPSRMPNAATPSNVAGTPSNRCRSIT